MTEVTFSRLDPDDLGRFTHLAVVPFADTLKLSRSIVEARWLDEVGSVLAESGAGGIAAEASGKVCGLVMFAPLPWESGILAKRMSAIKYLLVDGTFPAHEAVCERLLEKCIQQVACDNVDFLMCKVSELDKMSERALENQGFELMDVLLDFIYDFGDQGSPRKIQSCLPAGFNFRLAVSSDAESLTKTARAGFSDHFGRFHRDPQIGREKATRLYEEWIRSCLDGWADWILLAVHGDRIAGYSAWKEASLSDLRHGISLAHYSIAGTHPDYSGRGLFTSLTAEGMNRLGSQFGYIEGPTHIDNVPVQRAYGKLGWKMVGRQRSYHKWLKTGIGVISNR